jgi:preprotein translocase subunit SecG
LPPCVSLCCLFPICCKPSSRTEFNAPAGVWFRQDSLCFALILSGFLPLQLVPANATIDVVRQTEERLNKGDSVLLKIILIVLEVLVCLGLITTILMQSGRVAGMSGAIAGGAQSLLGKKKGLDEFLSKVSFGLAAAFFVITLLIAVVE